ncbi:hypothetical protein AB0I77_15445 [Streptomyces sp. NPDC050619]|uniref:hypothetical protein n=1 Tax=Streptomyces sp. NPDC050619 TaxID=3157214 RepID=UPI00341B349E
MRWPVNSPLSVYFVWLGVAMLTTILLLVSFGLPRHSSKQEATGTVPAGGGRVIFTIDSVGETLPARTYQTIRMRSGGHL